MTDQPKAQVDVAFWRKGESGYYVEEASDRTDTLPSGGWHGEVTAVAETLLSEDFEGIAIVVDVDDKGAGAIMDVVAVSYVEPARPAKVLNLR